MTILNGYTINDLTLEEAFNELKEMKETLDQERMDFTNRALELSININNVMLRIKDAQAKQAENDYNEWFGAKESNQFNQRGAF